MDPSSESLDVEEWGDAEAGWGDVDDASWEDSESSKPSPAAPSKALEECTAKPITFFIESELEGNRQQLIRQAAELLFVSRDEAACLLHASGWKIRKLQTEWFASADKVRSTVGLTKSETSCESKKLIQCETAFCDTVPSSEATALPCGHSFCNECWKGFLLSQLTSGRVAVNTRCPGLRCRLDHPHGFGCRCIEMVPEQFFAKFIQDQALLVKYNRWLLDSYMEGQRNIKWCPNPKCSYAVSCNLGGASSIKCKCGYSWCFSCSQADHTPTPCDLAEKWTKKEKSDDATAIWLAARTKECPKCSVRIEKNKACNHMTCIKCSHQFCWLCKAAWATHGSRTGPYSCDKYKEDNKQGKQSEEEKRAIENQRILAKYTYYYNRFCASAESIRLTQKLNDRFEGELKDKDFNKFTFVFDSLIKLIQSRRVLQWSFTLAYFLRACPEKVLFEYQQELLQGSIESLQDMMDNCSLEELQDKRRDIINRAAAMDKFRQEMISQVERGDFESALQAEPDAACDRWGCGHCKAENTQQAKKCKSCGACRLHGEQACLGCFSFDQIQQR